MSTKTKSSKSATQCPPRLQAYSRDELLYMLNEVRGNAELKRIMQKQHKTVKQATKKDLCTAIRRRSKKLTARRLIAGVGVAGALAVVGVAGAKRVNRAVSKSQTTTPPPKSSGTYYPKPSKVRDEYATTGLQWKSLIELKGPVTDLHYLREKVALYQYLKHIIAVNPQSNEEDVSWIRNNLLSTLQSHITELYTRVTPKDFIDTYKVPTRRSYNDIMHLLHYRDQIVADIAIVEHLLLHSDPSQKLKLTIVRDTLHTLEGSLYDEIMNPSAKRSSK